MRGPQGAMIDYREKLQGRAAYVCPRRECIERALLRNQLGRSLRTRLAVPSVEDFVLSVAAAVSHRISSLLAMAAKARKIAVGFSAVEDALGKGRVKLLLYTADISGGTKEKVHAAAKGSFPHHQCLELKTAELGPIIGRDLTGVIAIVDQGFADVLRNELERLKGLINTHA